MSQAGPRHLRLSTHVCVTVVTPLPVVLNAFLPGAPGDVNRHRHLTDKGTQAAEVTCQCHRIRRGGAETRVSFRAQSPWATVLPLQPAFWKRVGARWCRAPRCPHRAQGDAEVRAPRTPVPRGPRPHVPNTQGENRGEFHHIVLQQSEERAPSRPPNQWAGLAEWTRGRHRRQQQLGRAGDGH